MKLSNRELIFLLIGLLVSTLSYFLISVYKNQSFYNHLKIKKDEQQKKQDLAHTKDATQKTQDQQAIKHDETQIKQIEAEIKKDHAASQIKINALKKQGANAHHSTTGHVPPPPPLPTR